jgi:hypothetical protein
MTEFKNGDKVFYTHERNGYWNDLVPAIFLEDRPGDKVKIRLLKIPRKDNLETPRLVRTVRRNSIHERV